jgi:integrase
MPRPLTGALYSTDGHWFVSILVEKGKRPSFHLATCVTKEEAEKRRVVLVDIVRRLKSAEKADLAEILCCEAGKADSFRLQGILKIVDGVISGREQRANSRPDGRDAITFEQFGRKWTGNEIAHEFRRRVKVIDHHDNAARLEKHVYPVVYKPSIITDDTSYVGSRIGDVPMRDFTVEHADFVLARPTLTDGSVHNVAALIRRICRLAVYPAKIVRVCCLPPGWSPAPNAQKEKSYLFPKEEQKLLANRDVPLVRRLLYGFVNREGPRKENAVTIEWSQLTLDDLPDGGGHIVLDTTKNGRGGSWSLGSGTAEALRRWKTICPSERYAFPAGAVPGHRNKERPMYVDKLAEQLRDDLRASGVTRAKLFEKSEHRMNLRAHDLRGTFVTVSLAQGRSEAWVATRTGHRSTIMISRYKTEAMTAEELNLGALAPLHLAIPELAEIDPNRATNGASVIHVEFGRAAP